MRSYKYAQLSSYNDQGISPKDWNEKYNISNDDFKGDELVMVTTKNNTKIELPIKDAALVLYGIERCTKTSIWKSLDLSNTIWSFSKFIGFIPRSELCVVYGDGTNPLIESNLLDHVVIPLGYLDKKSDKSQIILQNQAHHILKTDTDDQYVGILYMKVLKSLVYMSANSKTIEQQKHLISTSFFVARAMKKYFELYPNSYKSLDPLIYDENAEDVLERTLIFVFQKNKWNARTFWSILIKNFQRMIFHSKTIPTSDIIKTQGPITCFIFCPILKEYFNDNKSFDTCQQDFNNSVETLLEELVNMVSEKESNLNINSYILQKLAQYNNFAINKQSADHILEWISLNSEPKNQISLKKFGLADDIKASFEYDLDVRPNCRLTSSDNESFLNSIYNDEYDIVIQSSDPTQWSGIKFKSTGIYKIKCKTLGMSVQMAGNTYGKELIQNISFSLPNKITGDSYSVDNASWNITLGNGRECYWNGYVWHYRDYEHGVFDFNEIITIEYQKNYIVTIKRENGSVYLETQATDSGFVLGYKNVILQIDHKDIKSIETILEQLDHKDINTGETILEHIDRPKNNVTLENLTPSAILNQLKNLASK